MKRPWLPILLVAPFLLAPVVGGGRLTDLNCAPGQAPRRTSVEGEWECFTPTAGGSSNSFATIGTAVSDSSSDSFAIIDSATVDFSVADNPESLTAAAIDVTCTGCLGSAEIVALDASDTTTGTFSDALIPGGVTRDAEAAAAYQPLDSDLTSIATVATTSFGRGLLDDADSAAGRSTLGLIVGTDVQAQDTDLVDLADGELTASKVVSATTSRCARFDATGNLAPASGDCAAGDTTGGGGGGNAVETTLALTAAGYFATTVTGQAWVTSTSKITCAPLGTTADGLTPEVVAVAGLDVSVANRVNATGFDVLVFSPNGLEGTVRIHCIGV